MSKNQVLKAAGVALSALLLVGLLPAETPHHSTKKKSSSKSVKVHSTKSSSKHGRKTVKKARGQKAIDSDRTRAIQAALIREHYLDGEPSGNFDQRTKDALQRFQKDNGWQSKVIPDSRALIKLGLGPSKDGLLNPESAAVASPYELGAEREIPGGSTPLQRK